MPEEELFIDELIRANPENVEQDSSQGINNIVDEAEPDSQPDQEN